MMLSRSRMTAGLVVLVCAAVLMSHPVAAQQDKTSPDKMELLTKDVTQGALRVVKEDGGVVECPLKHTDVKATVSGFIARVKVTQTFHNPLKEKIEAVYVFPLPHKAAVDEMTMVVGRRRVVGVIRRRAAAREIYEQALAAGATAALLEQERPNIFTQSVGNIAPGQEVKIEISYVDVLEYDMGTYEFHFPMVVGPRYIPGKPTSTIPPVPPELKGKVGELDKRKVREGPDKPTGTGWAPDTGRVPDASRITPPVLKPGYRNGHDISLSVELNAGVPIQNLKVINHKADISEKGASQAKIKLASGDSVPNKDFVLRYDVVGQKPAIAVLSYTDESGYGTFMLMVQPAEDERLTKSPPREICFLIDVSGSMSGQPTAKVRDCMEKMLKLTKPQDTLQVITFAGRSKKFFERAVPATKENINSAVNFTRGLRGGGGTEMLKGIKMAINEPLDPERVRIVIMLTDGFIGNEAEIIAEVGKRCGDRIRFWGLGIGTSVNRFLIDGVARQGGGMGKVLGLSEDPTNMVQEIMTRIHRAQLAGISIDWRGLQVSETYPAKIPELWAGRPVILFGRYEPGGGAAAIEISGQAEGEPVHWMLDVDLPAFAEQNDVLEKVWARQKIEDLMHQTYYVGSPEVEDAVTEIALSYKLMSQYTSFVAVDERTLGKLGEPARPPRRMLVPVPIPEGTRYEGFFGPAGGMEFEEKKLEATEVAGRGIWATRFVARAEAKEIARLRTGTLNQLRRRAPAPPYGTRLSDALRLAPRLPYARAMAEKGALMYPKKPAREYAREVSGLIMFSDGSYVVAGGLARPTDAERQAVAYAENALRATIGELAKYAQAVLNEADALRKKGDFAAARAMYVYAYLLDSAAYSRRASTGEVSGKALAAIEDIDKERVKALIALGKKLDLVIRDKSIPESLQAVSKASGVEIEFLKGSVADACAILQRKDVRVTYLDLRNATAAQALDWTLRPARMTWWIRDGKVIAGTARRGPEKSAWVYDVSLIAIPTRKEIEQHKDQRKRMDAAKKASDDFIAAIRKTLSLDEKSAVWYAPGQLLIFAHAKTHEAASTLFESLADPLADMVAGLNRLHTETVRRAKERRPEFDRLLEALERNRVIGKLHTFSWRLLAAAADGKLDLEALTELQIAWKRPEMAEILKGKTHLTVLRSLWAITESAKALPKQAEFQALAKQVRVLSAPAAKAAMDAFTASSLRDHSAFASALYATLARRDSRVPAVFSRQAAPYRAIAVTLLARAGKSEQKQLVELVRKTPEQVRGADMTVFTALACRRAGGGAWKAFRSEARDILGKQPLPGSVVVLANRLARLRSPIVAAR